MNDKEKLDSFIWTVISVVGVALTSSDVYFIKRTLDRLDSLETTVWQLKEQVAVMNNSHRLSSFGQNQYQCLPQMLNLEEEILFSRLSPLSPKPSPLVF